jgi:beta-glucosidase
VAKLDGLRAALAAAHPDIHFTTDHHHADVAVLFVNPSTGDYFHATGLLDLDVHEGTNVALAKIIAIRAAVAEVVIGLNITLPWLLGTIEPLADALVAGFDTRTEALFEAIVGTFVPSGRLPLTFPVDNAAIAVDEHGRCASPNDVPGYDKERYMDGRPYVYTDGDGNRYELGHGLALEV